MLRTAIWILWPSFIVGGLAETVFFTLFDPHDMTLFGESLALSRTTAYSIGFFAFWGFAAASSALTLFLRRSGGGDGRASSTGPATSE